MIVAKTLEITRGTKDLVLSSLSMISTANITPAMGVLKEAASPPAAPQASKIFTPFVGSFSQPANMDPAAAPICTMGPSRQRSLRKR